MKFVVDRNPTPLLVECVKTIRHRSMKREEVLLRALLELYQDMPLRIPTKELNDLDSYRRLEEVRRCSNKKLAVTRELLEKVQMMDIEPFLIASGYRTWWNILLSHGEYPCHCLAQTFWYPRRANLVLVWDAEKLYSMGLPDQTQNVTILLVSAMLEVRLLEANAGERPYRRWPCQIQSN